MTKRFIVTDGRIQSRNDGDFHHVSRTDVVKLFGVKTDDWEVYDPIKHPMIIDDCIILAPKENGKYHLSEEVYIQMERRIIPNALNKYRKGIEKLDFWERLKFLFTSKIRI